MDNLTHTLFGLCLAKTGLERTTPLATATLLISSSLPDIDSVMRLRGSIDHLEHHRGITHSFVGIAVLALLLTLLLKFVDSRFRMRRDRFGRPIRVWRVFWLACLGGLGHTFMDFTNSYGVRPLLPFSGRWFYGDLAFVVDPWIWLILGSAAVWLTAVSMVRGVAWTVAGTGLTLLVALAFREPSVSPAGVQMLPISDVVRGIWFAGLLVIILGALMRWGRGGARLARYSLVVLTIYYFGMWAAGESALQEVRKSQPSDAVSSFAVWPAPADPTIWQSVAASSGALYVRNTRLGQTMQADWQEMAVLDQRFAEALRQSKEGKTFLDFSRYAAATVEERDDGYAVVLRDLRFPLVMRVRLNSEMVVEATDLRWYQ
jgi:inner membrane protein